jgi:hypothetical protein
MDKRFNRASLIVLGSVGWVAVARGQAGGRRHERAWRRAETSVDGSWLLGEALVADVLTTYNAPRSEHRRAKAFPLVGKFYSWCRLIRVVHS